jgi:hypothetical protein
MLDYETDISLQERSDQIILRNSNDQTDGMCKKSNIAFIALNSSYIYYTKLLFVKYDESQVAVSINLFSMIGSQEQPPTNPKTGKVNLQVDDAQWTPDN